MDARIRQIGMALGSGLTALLWLASTSVPPMLTVSELDGADDGTTVQVRGMVVEMRAYDTGFQSMILVDLATGETAQVLLTPSMTEDALEQATIGDEVLVIGVVALEGSERLLFAERHSVRVIAKSADVMRVETLCMNWRLFEYDRLNVTGVVAIDADSGSAWLVGTLGTPRLRLTAAADQTRANDGTLVTADCTLLMDAHTMSLYLKAWDITPRPT